MTDDKTKDYIREGSLQFPAFGTKDSEWIGNANFPNSYRLEKTVSILGGSWLYDKFYKRVYGWVSEVTTGVHKGKFRAEQPVYDEDQEFTILGYFDTVELAMAAVLSSNHPDYNSVWI